MSLVQKTINEKFESFVRRNPLKTNVVKGGKLVLVGGKSIEYQFKPYNNSIPKGNDFDFTYYVDEYKNTFKKSEVIGLINKLGSFFIPYLRKFIEEELKGEYSLYPKYWLEKGRYNNIFDNGSSFNVDVMYQNKPLRRKLITVVRYILKDSEGKEFELMDLAFATNKFIRSHLIEVVNGFPVYKKKYLLLYNLSYFLRASESKFINLENFEKIRKRLKKMLGVVKSEFKGSEYARLKVLSNMDRKEIIDMNKKDNDMFIRYKAFDYIFNKNESIKTISKTPRSTVKRSISKTPRATFKRSISKTPRSTLKRTISKKPRATRKSI